jgi:hypothetical protein
MRLLQHFHPQGSHIFRSIVESAKFMDVSLNSVELISIVGANFLPNCADESTLINLLVPPLKSSRIEHVPNHLFSFDTYLLMGLENFTCSSEHLNSDEAALLDNSVRDSINRGLSRFISTLDFYLDSESEYSRALFYQRRSYALCLLDYYLSLIDIVSPDIISISHGNYDYYVALYIAARLRRIPVLIVQGGFNRSWLIRNSADVADQSPSSEKIRLYKALSDTSPKQITLRDSLQEFVCSYANSSISINAHRDSSLSVIASSYLRSLENSGPITYLLMMPILGEVCHQDLFHDTFYKSKPEWIFSLLQLLSTLPHELVIRHHPELDFYQERHTVVRFLDTLASKYSIRISHIFSNDDLSKFVSERICTGASCIPLSFGSSISSELASVNFASITANGCLASLIPSATIYQHECDLHDPRPQLIAASRRLVSSDSYSMDMSLLLKWLNLTGKYHSSDKSLRKRADLHLFFGRKPLMPAPEIRYTLEDYINTLDLDWHSVGDCLHFFARHR